MHHGALHALSSAVLFGASTPFARWMAVRIHPVFLAGLLYLGAGVGLSVWALVRRGRSGEAPIVRKDLPWLGGTIVIGGVLAPVALMLALRTTEATTASLLLNTEAVFTTLLAWVVFHENASGTVVAGMAAIVTGGGLLALQGGSVERPGVGAWLVVAACLGWAIDNNLTQKLSARDPVHLSALRGLSAGVVNLSLAVALGARWPGVGAVAASMGVGVVGYGASLVLFLSALRTLGSARTGAYFSAAPFVGAILGAVLLHEAVGAWTFAGGAFMGLGVLLHLRERHEHPHLHPAVTHEHRHTHDEHHRHPHPPGMSEAQAHSHPHAHEALAHTHPHTPDIHHRHPHSG